MKLKLSTQKLCMAALLIAVGIVIPMFMPIKLVIPPASYTLASHVAVFIAMMISPGIAISVTLGTTAGFLLGGFPIIIVLRAASHLLFAVAGSVYLKMNPDIIGKNISVRVFSLVIGLIHGICEAIVVTFFSFGGRLDAIWGNDEYVTSVLLLVGVGTVLHSVVDFEIALIIAKVMKKQKSLSALIVAK